MSSLCKNQNKDQEDLQFFMLSLLNHGGSVSRDTRKGPFSLELHLSALLVECQYCVDTLDFYFSLIKRYPAPLPSPPPVVLYDGFSVMAAMPNSFIREALYRHGVITAAASDLNFGLYPAIL